MFLSTSKAREEGFLPERVLQEQLSRRLEYPEDLPDAPCRKYILDPGWGSRIRCTAPFSSFPDSSRILVIRPVSESDALGKAPDLDLLENVLPVEEEPDELVLFGPAEIEEEGVRAREFVRVVHQGRYSVFFGNGFGRGSQLIGHLGFGGLPDRELLTDIHAIKARSPLGSPDAVAAGERQSQDRSSNKAREHSNFHKILLFWLSCG